MSKRVAVYARVSTTRQAENDISIPDQLAQAKRHCQDRGWIVVREFVDPGASARDDKRPEFQRMMDAACSDPSPFDAVLVHSQSRFFRDAAGYVVSKRKLEKHGVLLVSMTQDFGQGASAEFAETVIAASDALHSAETAKHVTRTMLENARQGFWNGAKPPFGYRTVDVEQRGQRIKKHLAIEPKEAETIRLIFRLFVEGDGKRGSLGVKHIATWLNDHKLLNGRGKPFYTSEVHAILTRNAYAGTYYYNQTDSRTGRQRPKQDWVPVPVPAIVSADDFAKVQALLHQRRSAITPPRVTNSEVLLTGLARCECCGSAMMLRTGTGESGKTYRYYTCAGRQLKGRSVCGKPVSIPEHQLDQLVIGALADHLLTPERLPTLLREAYRHAKTDEAGKAHRRTALRKQLKDSEQQIDRLHTAVAEGTVPDSSLLKDKLAALHARREETLRFLALLDGEAPPLRRALSNQQALTVAATLKQRLLDAPPPLQRRYVRGLVSDILVNRDTAVISGPKQVLAAAVSESALPGQVRSLVREWRALGESNSSCKIENLES